MELLKFRENSVLEAFSQTSPSITNQSPNDYASPVFASSRFTGYQVKVGNQGLNHKLSYSKKKKELGRSRLYFDFVFKTNSLVIKHFQIYLFATTLISWLECNSLGLFVACVKYSRLEFGLPVGSVSFYTKVDCDTDHQEKHNSSANNDKKDCFVQTKNFIFVRVIYTSGIIKNQLYYYQRLFFYQGRLYKKVIKINYN